VPAIDPALINLELPSAGKVSTYGKVQSNLPDEPIVLAADKISKNDTDLQQQDHAAPSGVEHPAMPSQGR
jgi:hypothetical protein